MVSDTGDAGLRTEQPLLKLSRVAARIPRQYSAWCCHPSRMQMRTRRYTAVGLLHMWFHPRKQKMTRGERGYAGTCGQHAAEWPSSWTPHSVFPLSSQSISDLPFSHTIDSQISTMIHLETISEASVRSGPGELKSTPYEKIKEAEEQDKWDGSSITKKYHRLRAEYVPEFLEGLRQNEKEKLRVDAERVKWCRARLEKSEENRLLFEEVHDSFMQWRSEAESKRKVQFIYAADKRAEHCKDPDSLPKGDTSRPRRDVGDTDPAHDFKAGFLFFQKYKTGWKKATHHGYGFDTHERFPNQKITIKKALSGEDNPFAETKDENGERHLKYIHLPANHMGWVEVSCLIRK